MSAEINLNEPFRSPELGRRIMSRVTRLLHAVSGYPGEYFTKELDTDSPARLPFIDLYQH